MLQLRTSYHEDYNIFLKDELCVFEVVSFTLHTLQYLFLNKQNIQNKIIQNEIETHCFFLLQFCYAILILFYKTVLFGKNKKNTKTRQDDRFFWEKIQEHKLRAKIILEGNECKKIQIFFSLQQRKREVCSGKQKELCVLKDLLVFSLSCSSVVVAATIGAFLVFFVQNNK